MTARVSEIVAMALDGSGGYGSDGYGFHILSENRLLVTLAFATWKTPSRRGARSRGLSKGRLRSRRTELQRRDPQAGGGRLRECYG
jgi:hypothetical protein